MFKTDYVKQGIYFLFFKGKLQYIGKSVSVFSRIAQHDGQFEYDEVWFMPVRGGARELLDVESQLIYIFAPPCNRQGIPNGEDILLSVGERFRKTFRTTREDVLSDFTSENGEIENGIDYYDFPSGTIGFWQFPFDMCSTLLPSNMEIEEVAEYAEKVAFSKSFALEIWRELFQAKERKEVCRE